MIYALITPKLMGRVIKLRKDADALVDLVQRGDKVVQIPDNMPKQSVDIICQLIDHKISTGDYISV